MPFLDITASNASSASLADPFYNLAGINFQSDPLGVNDSPVSPVSNATATTEKGVSTPANSQLAQNLAQPQVLPFSTSETAGGGLNIPLIAAAGIGVVILIVLAVMFRR